MSLQAALAEPKDIQHNHATVKQRFIAVRRLDGTTSEYRPVDSVTAQMPDPLMAFTAQHLVERRYGRIPDESHQVGIKITLK